MAGYTRWFDVTMLGRTRRARTELARRLRSCRTVLDLGCGGGELAGALVAAGVAEVWGIDPSPYLLHEAARRHASVRFVQGIAEATGFPNEHFDGAGACFVFHELPPRAADRALVELRRILAPGATLAIAEPSPLQFDLREVGRHIRRHGILGLYFWLVTRAVYEPFVAGWHCRDLHQWLEAGGFELDTDEIGMPIRLVSATRR